MKNIKALNADFRRLAILAVASALSNTRTWIWICIRWRRTILKMAMWHMTEIHNPMNIPEAIEGNRILSSQNWVVPTNTETAQIAKRIQVTLRTVTMLGYCSGFTMAMSLSRLIPEIMHRDAPQRENPVALYPILNVSFSFSGRGYKWFRLLAMKRGCTIKPTAKSVDARPHSNRIEGERSDGVFHTAYSTITFPMVAVKASAMFTTQFTNMIALSSFSMSSSRLNLTNTE